MWGPERLDARRIGRVTQTGMTWRSFGLRAAVCRAFDESGGSAQPGSGRNSLELCRFSSAPQGIYSCFASPLFCFVLSCGSTNGSILVRLSAGRLMAFQLGPHPYQGSAPGSVSPESHLRPVRMTYR